MDFYNAHDFSYDRTKYIICVLLLVRRDCCFSVAVVVVVMLCVLGRVSATLNDPDQPQSNVAYSYRLISLFAPHTYIIHMLNTKCNVKIETDPRRIYVCIGMLGVLICICQQKINLTWHLVCVCVSLSPSLFLSLSSYTRQRFLCVLNTFSLFFIRSAIHVAFPLHITTATTTPTTEKHKTQTTCTE